MNETELGPPYYAVRDNVANIFPLIFFLNIHLRDWKGAQRAHKGCKFYLANQNF